MVDVKITVTGVQDTMSYFQRKASGIVSEFAIPAAKDWAIALRDNIIPREHFRSGRMRAMTKISPINNGWAVIIDVPYAERENMRKGNKRGTKGGGQGTPHRFVEPAMKEVDRSQYMALLVKLTSFLQS